MKAKCQRTGKEIETKDGFFVSPGRSGDWEFISIDAPSKNDYNIAVEDLVKSPESLIDWLAHLSEKSWFSSEKFFDFMYKFRAENRLYNML
ncbi:MAG: hypothetical protein PHE73_09315 [Sulfurovaceae bacterium]|nr:hypothetical protein [Sulfurovaceae bacterium]